jgi:hypothetical protein
MRGQVSAPDAIDATCRLPRLPARRTRPRPRRRVKTAARRARGRPASPITTQIYNIDSLIQNAPLERAPRRGRHDERHTHAHDFRPDDGAAYGNPGDGGYARARRRYSMAPGHRRHLGRRTSPGRAGTWPKTAMEAARLFYFASGRPFGDQRLIISTHLL